MNEVVLKLYRLFLNSNGTVSSTQQVLDLVGMLSRSMHPEDRRVGAALNLFVTKYKVNK